MLAIGSVIVAGVYFVVQSTTKKTEAGLEETVQQAKEQAASTPRLTPEEEYDRGLKALEVGESGPAYELAARWFRLAADHGHVPAQFETARLLWFGLGAPADPGAARRYAREAASKGFPPAVTLAGIWETTAEDGDTEQGLRWLGAAAEDDDPWAQARLALIHLEGKLLEADDLTALYWAERAHALAPEDAEELRLLAWQRIPASSRALTVALLAGQLGREVVPPVTPGN